MTYDALMKDLKAGKIKPVYLLEGEEDFFIDQVSDFFEHRFLSESEKDFNLSVFYGKDADWSAVVNACRRYPMFAQKQVVMLKEAQSMKSLDKLETYLQDLMDSTVLVIAHKHKKLDGRSKLSKLISKKGVVMSVKRVYDNKIPDWIKTYVKSKGYEINTKAIMLLADHLGTDLSLQANDMGIMLFNLPAGKTIDDKDVEQYLGISREFNIFEFQNALGNKDMPKVMRIANYFAANPKAAPLPLMFPVLYNFFSKVHLMVCLPARSDREQASMLGVNPFFLKDYQRAAKVYQRVGVERVLLLLHEYNLRMLGINDAGTDDAGLMKEMIGRIMHG
jgi:DNA polymerase-3 subunit delta